MSNFLVQILMYQYDHKCYIIETNLTETFDDSFRDQLVVAIVREPDFVPNGWDTPLSSSSLIGLSNVTLQM